MSIPGIQESLTGEGERKSVSLTIRKHDERPVLIIELENSDGTLGFELGIEQAQIVLVGFAQELAELMDRVNSASECP